MYPLAMIAFPGPGILILLLAAVSLLSTSLVTLYFGTTTKQFLQPRAQIAFVGSAQLGVVFFAAYRLHSATAGFLAHRITRDLGHRSRTTGCAARLDEL